MNYFNELQQRIREIRLSEKFFYQKIRDIYTTSIDYDSQDEKTILFFKKVQNKLLCGKMRVRPRFCAFLHFWAKSKFYSNLYP